MKKATFFLPLIILLWSCHKQQYPIYPYPSPGSYSVQNRSMPISQAEPDLLASASDVFMEGAWELELVEKEKLVEAEVSNRPSSAEIKKGFSPAIQKRKNLDKKDRKQVNRALKSADKPNSDDKKRRIAAAISTVFGLVSIVFLLLPNYFRLTQPLGFAFVAGLLLSVVGIVLGKTSVDQVDTMKDPAFWRRLSYVGLISCVVALAIGLGGLLSRGLLQAIVNGF